MKIEKSTGSIEYLHFRTKRIIATASLKIKINLERLAHLPNAKYGPSKSKKYFIDLSFRKGLHRVHAMIFQKGNLVFAGAKTPGEYEEILKKVLIILRQMGIRTKKKPRLTIKSS